MYLSRGRSSQFIIPDFLFIFVCAQLPQDVSFLLPYSAHIMAPSTVALVYIFSPLFLYFNDIFRTEGLIALHSSLSEYYGGDLRTNTVTIIGATLDLQEKDYKPSMRVLSIN
jgi:hypothetical protein